MDVMSQALDKATKEPVKLTLQAMRALDGQADIIVVERDNGFWDLPRKGEALISARVVAKEPSMNEDNVIRLEGSVKGIAAQLECLDVHREAITNGEAEILIVVRIGKAQDGLESKVAYS
jgi:hypothetical protein